MLDWVLQGDPGLRAEVAGTVLEGQHDGNSVHFDLPTSATVRLRSTTAVPHETGGADDRRRLGVAVAELLLDGRAVALAESSWRQMPCAVAA